MKLNKKKKNKRKEKKTKRKGNRFPHPLRKVLFIPYCCGSCDATPLFLFTFRKTSQIQKQSQNRKGAGGRFDGRK
jgi:hypothetical protein